MDSKLRSTIPDEVIKEASDFLNNAARVLKPYLVALSSAERMSLPKMSDKTQPFVEKTIAYSKNYPQFAPSYMDTKALDANHKTYDQLRPLFRVVKQLSDGLDDTTMEAGAACYANALNYYNSVKHAARIDVPGAKAIHDDLRKRFVKPKTDKDTKPS